MKVDVEAPNTWCLAARRVCSRAVRARWSSRIVRLDLRPANHQVVERLREADYRIEPFGSSDTRVNDSMYNFLATPKSGRSATQSDA
jgi:hypothetical protein